ncbi:hypothetical protein DRO31_05615 [Candidatus Bathyarchaeota archaeon]|nr:MAG: hypothetical protein DRO31_05615 [Candidatus Bathyarchaeota archaeon]
MALILFWQKKLPFTFQFQNSIAYFVDTLEAKNRIFNGDHLEVVSQLGVSFPAWELPVQIFRDYPTLAQIHNDIALHAGVAGSRLCAGPLVVPWTGDAQFPYLYERGPWYWPYYWNIEGTTPDQQGLQQFWIPWEDRGKTSKKPVATSVMEYTKILWTFPTTTYDGRLSEYPTRIYWYKLFCEPVKVDFGFGKVGDARTTTVFHRYDVPHNLTSINIGDPALEVVIPFTLPHSIPPGHEFEATIRIARTTGLRLVDIPIYFRFETIGDAICYVSAILAVLLMHDSRWFDQWDRPTTSQILSYSYETEVVRFQDSTEHRIPRLLAPVRKTKIHLYGLENVSFEVDEDMVNSARFLVIVPIFPWRVRLSANANAGDTAITVTDATDFLEKYYLIIQEQNKVEALMVESKSGNTLELSGPLIYNYTSAGAWVYPAMGGIGRVQRARSMVDHRVYTLEIEVTERLPILESEISGSTTTWIVRPQTVEVEQSVKDTRLIEGEKTGIPSIKVLSSSKLRDPKRFEHEYYLIDKSLWRGLIDMFNYARGRWREVTIATWTADLRTAQNHVAGETLIKCYPQEFANYASMYSQLLIDYRTSTQLVNITGVSIESDIVNIAIDPALERDLPAGSPVHLVLNAYFSDDTLELEFKNELFCIVKVGWEEKV